MPSTCFCIVRLELRTTPWSQTASSGNMSTPTRSFFIRFLNIRDEASHANWAFSAFSQSQFDDIHSSTSLMQRRSTQSEVEAFAAVQLAWSCVSSACECCIYSNLLNVCSVKYEEEGAQNWTLWYANNKQINAAFLLHHLHLWRITVHHQQMQEGKFLTVFWMSHAKVKGIQKSPVS